MFNESPRFAAFLASGLTILALGVGGTALADQPADGTAGNAHVKANPAGQDVNGSGDRSGAPDANHGFRCDGNNGVGVGNPAFTGCGTSLNSDPTPPQGKSNSAGGSGKSSTAGGNNQPLAPGAGSANT